jgi:hypothetical protein
MDGQYEKTVRGPREVDPTELPRIPVAYGERKHRDIFNGDDSKLVQLKKAKLNEDPERKGETGSNLANQEGILAPLIVKSDARDLRDYNATHSICLDAKRSSSVGLGHRDRDIHEKLDPLTRFGWQDVLDSVADDYWEGGEGFIEVVFGEDSSGNRVISGLHHLEGDRVQIVLEEPDNSEDYHYMVEGDVGSGGILVMARWGDLDDLKARFGVVEGLEAQTVPASEASSVRRLTGYGTIVDSEIIHWRQPTNRSRYHGYPDYMAAVPSIELVQCMTQHEFDFYFNRGVPEFILFLIGKNMGDCWGQVTNLIKGSQGLGNSHKTGAINIPGDPEEVVVQLEKLAMEDAANSGFAEKSNTLDMRICTAHGMPPQLANIALPGKMGSANEGPNAMLTFQMRKLGQAQKALSSLLASTLGDKQTSLAQPEGAPVKLSRDQFLAKDAKPMDDNGMPQFVQPGNGFATILDGMTLGAQQTMAKMQDPAAATDRNPDDGLLDGSRDRKAGDRKQTRGPGTGE